MRPSSTWLLVALAAFVFLAPAGAQAQASAPPGVAGTFTQQQLDQMLAPVALYPDPLLAQVFMASTYPLEVVSAARWVNANPGVTGKALEAAMKKQPWDPAVKALAAVPSVLQMMNERIEWTQELGDAFLAQRKDVFGTVQALRRKAHAAGNLVPTEEQRVVVENETIVIQPTSSTVVYVPIYNPTVVYGAWWYPAYLPYYWYPPRYVHAPGIGFAAGVVVGAALWGGCNWHDRDVNININNYQRFNHTSITSVKWEHNAAHRKGVAYRDSAVAQRYNRNQTARVDGRDARAERVEDRPAVRDASPSRAAARDLDRAAPGPNRAAFDRDERGRPGRPGRD